MYLGMYLQGSRTYIPLHFSTIVSIHSEVMTRWNPFSMFVAQVMLNPPYLGFMDYIVVEFHDTCNQENFYLTMQKHWDLWVKEWKMKIWFFFSKFYIFITHAFLLTCFLSCNSISHIIRRKLLFRCIISPLSAALTP